SSSRRKPGSRDFHWHERRRWVPPCAGTTRWRTLQAVRKRCCVCAPTAVTSADAIAHNRTAHSGREGCIRMTTPFLCFGELLLGLGAPGRERLLQTPRFDVHVGGAEANVAVALAQFGHAVAMAGVVADNALGAAALGELRRRGVDTTRIATVPGRMGLYFLET